VVCHSLVHGKQVHQCPPSAAREGEVERPPECAVRQDAGTCLLVEVPRPTRQVLLSMRYRPRFLDWNSSNRIFCGMVSDRSKKHMIITQKIAVAQLQCVHSRLRLRRWTRGGCLENGKNGFVKNHVSRNVNTSRVYI
jgi:hypothetical protein